MIKIAKPTITADDTFMAISHLVAMRSKCLKLQVGAVLVDQEGHIIATGYNGPPRKTPHCGEIGGCGRMGVKSLEVSGSCRAVHAEENLIIQASLHHASTRNGAVYVTHFPCMQCTKSLANARVKEVVYSEPYDMENEFKMAIISDAKISVRQHKLALRIELINQVLDPAVAERLDGVSGCNGEFVG